jgi:hypothetical protein
MVKSRSKISRQPVKKSTKTAACSAGARTLGKSQSAKSAARPAPSKTAAKGKWVYTFGGGKAQGRADVRNLLGGKGAGLAEMARLGLPVPPGFSISTEVCTYFYQNGNARNARTIMIGVELHALFFCSLLVTAACALSHSGKSPMLWFLIGSRCKNLLVAAPVAIGLGDRDL